MRSCETCALDAFDARCRACGFTTDFDAWTPRNPAKLPEADLPREDPDCLACHNRGNRGLCEECLDSADGYKRRFLFADKAPAKLPLGTVPLYMCPTSPPCFHCPSAELHDSENCKHRANKYGCVECLIAGFRIPADKADTWRY